MLEPQTYTCWRISCRTASDSRMLQSKVHSLISLDRRIVDRQRTFPNGKEVERQQDHLLRDYFSEISVISSDELVAKFRLVFHRKSMAGRFWKDLMVTILGEVEANLETVSVELEYKGDKEPAQMAG